MRARRKIDKPNSPTMASNLSHGTLAASEGSTEGNTEGAADMTIVVTRVDLFDSEKFSNSNHEAEEVLQTPALPPPPPILPFRYDPSLTSSDIGPTRGSVAVCRVAPDPNHCPPAQPQWLQIPMMDTSTPCPSGNASLKKYWNQRRRLFSRFDQGIKLDDEGWYSVTPEQIAHTVAHNMRQFLGQIRADRENHFYVLDAFCCCGGNLIALAQQPNVTVIGMDLDRSKLRKAAHNAALYKIPPENLQLIEGNALFVLEFAFHHGEFVLDQPMSMDADKLAAMGQAMPKPVSSEVTEHGYQIGGIDLLPRRLDAVFMDPPWGGVDYEVFGMGGYDLERQMKISRPNPPPPPVADDFFDTFSTGNTTSTSKQSRMDQFNADMDHCVNGVELLAMAVQAVDPNTGLVVYDVPRNTNRPVMAHAALKAGLRGYGLWHEHYLNTRLKTATVYFGPVLEKLASKSNTNGAQEKSDS